MKKFLIGWAVAVLTALNLYQFQINRARCADISAMSSDLDKTHQHQKAGAP
jgi:hypothetical protein